MNRALTETSEGRTGIKQSTVQTHALKSGFVKRAMTKSDRHLEGEKMGTRESVIDRMLEDEYQKAKKERRGTLGDGLKIMINTVTGTVNSSGSGSDSGEKNNSGRRESITMGGADFSRDELKDMPSHLRPNSDRVTIVMDDGGEEKKEGGSNRSSASGGKRLSVKDRVSFFNNGVNNSATNNKNNNFTLNRSTR